MSNLSVEDIKKLNIHERLHLILSEVDDISKKGKVEFGSTKYKYAKEADFVEALQPLISKYRLSLTVQMEAMEPPPSRPELSQVKLVYLFTNIDSRTDKGQYEQVVMTGLGQGQDKGDKGIYKAITGAKKYIMANGFMIATHDDPEASDDEGRSTASQPAAKSSTSFRKPKKEEVKAAVNDDDNDL